MPANPTDPSHRPAPPRKRQRLSAVVQAGSRGDISLPAVLGGLAIVFGIAGWSAALFDGSFKSISEIIVRVIGSFIPSAATVTQGNWASRLGAVLAALTTVTGAFMVGLATLGEQVAKAKARHLWSAHTILIGDTLLARRLAEGFQVAGERVLHVVPADAPKSVEPGRIRIGYDPRAILAVTALRRARLVVADLGSDASTLSLGRSILNACETQPPARSLFKWPLRRPSKEPAALVLRVADSVLADQFAGVLDAERREKATSPVNSTLRPGMFDENRAIARYTLARDPLFVMASANKQPRVHAVVIGFGDLGEKLHDQILLTCAACSLDLPRVTVLDRHATRLEREFRARRPAVLGNIGTTFVDFDIGTDMLEGGVTAPFEKLLELEKAIGITAIFLALPGDGENLRAALLLRRHRQRNGTLNAPVFYRSRLSPGESDVLGSGDNRETPGRYIPMRIPADALLREVADAEGRDALARALHESYLRGEQPSEQATGAWEQLSETLRRANIRAADHLPAKLWSLGFEISGLLPGQIPALDQTAKQWLFGASETSPSLEAATKVQALARLEHDRWTIERQLDGWRFGPHYDDKRQLHPRLISWEALLEKFPADAAKDTNQVWAVLRVVSERGKRPLISLR
jgi:hypothetical protein